MTRALAGLAAVVILLATGCGSTKTVASRTSPSATPPGASATATPSGVTATPTPTPAGATPSPSPATSSSATFSLLPPPSGPPTGVNTTSISCLGPIGSSDPVAIVQLHTGAVVLRDYANPSQPRNACQFGGAPVLQLIDAQHVAVGGTATYGSATAKPVVLYAVVDLPSGHFHWFQLPGQGGQFLAVGPALDQVAWLNTDAAGTTDRIYVSDAAGNHLVATLSVSYGVCGSPENSNQAGYARTEAHLYVLDQSVPPRTALLVLAGLETKYSQVPPASGWSGNTIPRMAVWSPRSETLYYGQNGSVWRWTPDGGAQVFLQGVTWYYPTISQDGSRLVYSVIGANLVHSLYWIDLAHGGSPQLLKSGRDRPAFLTPNLLWYKSDHQNPCGPGGNAPLIYDFNDGSESPSIIDQVQFIWPAMSSNL